MSAEPRKVWPPRVVEAFATAKKLAGEANYRWAVSIGPLGQTGGFQVQPRALGGEILFESTLYGGRFLIDTEHGVRVAQRAYIMSRSKRGKAAA